MSVDLPARIPPLRRGGPLRRRLAWRRRGGIHTPTRTLRRGRSPRRRWPRRALVGLLALVVLLIVASIGTVVYARWRFDQIHRAHVSGLAPLKSNEPFDVLLVGTTGTRALETIVVGRVDPETRGVRLLTIPRETYVDVAGRQPSASGPQPISAAFRAGPSVLVETIAQSFHIPITYYVDVNFSQVNRIVDALGGIHLQFAYPVRDSYSGLNVTRTGCDLIDGSQARGLVESTHLYYFAGGSWRADPGTEASIIQREDAFYGAVASSTKSVVTNPIALNNLVAATTADLTIDATVSETKALYLGQLFRGLTASELKTRTLPVISFTARGGASVLAPAPLPDQRMIERFLSYGKHGTSASNHANLGNHSSSALTTIPGSPKANSTNVIYNKTPEPWNPVPC